MNHLLPGSFSGRQSGQYDVEMGSPLDKFFEDVESVKEELKELHRIYRSLEASNEQGKTLHNAKAVKELRSRMDSQVALALRKAKLVSVKLESLDRSNAANRSMPGCGAGSSSDRTRCSVVHGLRKKLLHAMDTFNALRLHISSEYRQTVQRRFFTVTGESPHEDTLDRLISTGESETFLQKAIQEQGKGRIIDTINEIQERHDAVKEIERNLDELHQVFLDMSVLVEAQGEQLNDIQSNVERSSSFARAATDSLQTAKVYQKSTRKWACYIVSILILLILFIVLFTVHPWRKNGGGGAQQ